MTIALALPRAAVRVIGWVLSPIIAATVLTVGFIFSSIKSLPGLAFLYGSGAVGEAIETAKEIFESYVGVQTPEYAPTA